MQQHVWVTTPTANTAGAAPASGERVLVWVAIVLLAFGLRPAVTSLGAVLSSVEKDLALSGWVSSLLTTLPVLCFAAVGALTHALTHRFGLHRVALASLAAIAIGGGARAVTDDAATFTTTTALALAGMAMGNVVLPPLVKLHFPDKIPTVTAVYSCALLAGASVPAGITVPVADAAGGWRWGLGLWALAAAAAAVPWLMLLRDDGRAEDPDEQHKAGPATPRLTPRALWGSPLAWTMAVFFGTQSAQAYAMFGWLPTIYLDAGLAPTSAALMLTIATAVAAPAPLVLPAYARRTTDHRPLVIAFAGLTALGLSGLLLAPTTVPWVWAACMGLGGVAFPWSLAILALRTRTPAGTAALSGFVQSMGYLLAAVGPLGAGLLRDATDGWTAPLLVLLSLTVPMLLTGLLIARPRLLEDEMRTEERPTTG